MTLRRCCLDPASRAGALTDFRLRHPREQRSQAARSGLSFFRSACDPAALARPFRQRYFAGNHPCDLWHSSRNSLICRRKRTGKRLDASPCVSSNAATHTLKHGRSRRCRGHGGSFAANDRAGAQPGTPVSPRSSSASQSTSRTLLRIMLTKQRVTTETTALALRRHGEEFPG